MELRTRYGWSEIGFVVLKGQQSHRRSLSGERLFSRSQVEIVNKDRYMSEIKEEIIATRKIILRQSIRMAVLSALMDAKEIVRGPHYGESEDETYYKVDDTIKAMTDLIEKYFNELTKER